MKGFFAIFPLYSLIGRSFKAVSWQSVNLKAVFLRIIINDESKNYKFTKMFNIVWEFKLQRNPVIKTLKEPGFITGEAITGEYLYRSQTEGTEILGFIAG